MVSGPAVCGMSPDGVRWSAGAAQGAASHRLLWGDAAEGPWCGAGPFDGGPALAAGRRRAAWSPADATALTSGAPSGGSADPPVAASVSGVVVDHPKGPVVAMLEALERAGTPASAGVGSVLVVAARPGDDLQAWIALGPLVAAIPVPCWPGHPQTAEAAGTGSRPARLAEVAAAVAGAVAGGRLSREEAADALGPARAAALLEGLEAERQARIMDAAGDDRGGAVRRIVAQAFAVGAAVAALEALLAAAGPAATPR